MTREKISGAVVPKGRSKALAIVDIGSELGELTESLNKRLQEAYLDMSTGRDHRRTHRGSSHRTSFIEYVSEVYNSRKEVRQWNIWITEFLSMKVISLKNMSEITEICQTTVSRCFPRPR